MIKNKQNINLKFFIDTLINKKFLFTLSTMLFLSSIGFFIEFNSIKKNKRYLVNVYIDNVSFKDYKKNNFPDFLNFINIRFKPKNILKEYTDLKIDFFKKIEQNKNTLINQDFDKEKISNILKLKYSFQIKEKNLDASTNNMYIQFSFRSKSLSNTELIYSRLFEILIQNVKQKYLSEIETKKIGLQDQYKRFNENLNILSSSSSKYSDKVLEEELANYLEFLNIQRDLSLNLKDKQDPESSKFKLYSSVYFQKGYEVIDKEINYLISLPKLDQLRLIDSKLKNQLLNSSIKKISKNNLKRRDLEMTKNFIKDIKLNNFVRYKIISYPRKYKYFKLIFYPIIALLITILVMVFNYENKEN